MHNHCSPALTSTFRLGLLFAFLGLPGLADAELVLVEGGESRAPILVAENPPPKARRAVAELADYLERIGGARPDIIEGTPDPLPANAIWVGYQPVLDKLFPELDFKFEQPEEILIAANQAHLVIAGRDRWDPAHLTVSGRNRTIQGKQQEYGTINAVYTFLQDTLDVRWFWPGPSGEDIIRRDRIALAPFSFRYHPPIRGRIDMFRLSALGDSRGHSHEWLRLQRVQLDSLAVPGGHPFAGWWDRFHETKRDFFALQPDGERSGFPDPRTVKLCKSNPAVWDQWLKDVEAERERDPNLLVFGANPNDSWNRGYCVCRDCLAWDHPEAETVRYTWQGLSQEYVAMSDRQITFANTLARRLEQRFPGERLLVSAMGYGGASLPAPVGVKPDDNVIVSLVVNLHATRRYNQHTQREQFRQWAAITQNLGWRPNLSGAAGWRAGLPGVTMRRVMEDLRFVADHGVIAIFFDTLWEHWANHGPHYYLLAQLVWNPHADGEAILADYFARAFGPASETMAAYWTLLETAAEAIIFQEKPQSEVWNDAFFARARAYLNRAVTELTDAPSHYADRVAFVQAGFDYLGLFLERQALLNRFREPGRDPEPELKAAIRQNWEQIASILERYPTAICRHFANNLRAETRTLLE